jgi:hypothetical protein
MNTDLERELRELFRDKAGDAPVAVPTSATAPQEILRRGRRRQVGTVAGALVAVSAVVIGSIAGMSSLLRGGDTVGGGDYEVFQRTATIEAFTVTSPSDWYLVNDWPRAVTTVVAADSGTCTIDPGGVETCDAPEPSDRIHQPFGLPVFQLTNVDVGLGLNACGSDLASDEAAFYVAVDYEASAGPTYAPWPGVRDDSGPCGHGRYANFTVNGRVFFAWAGFGDAVDDADRQVVLDAFTSMRVDDGWTPVPSESATPAYVLAGGTSQDGEPWRLELRPGEPTPELSIEGSGTSRLGGERVTVPTVQIDICCAVTDDTSAATFRDTAFGFVTKDATGVEFHVADAVGEATGEVLEGTIVPIPPSLDVIEADVFFVGGTAGLAGSVVPVVPAGDDPPTPAEVRTPVVELSGSYEGQAWTARFEGTFAEGTACVFVTVDEPYEPFCAELASTSFAGEWPYFNGTLTPDLYLLTGSIPPEVDGIRFISDDDAIVPKEVRCATGPLGWTDPDRYVCAIALPPSGSGTLRYLDAGGNVRFEEEIGWGVAEPESNQYPWTNEDTFITATGSFQSADWKLQVLYYRDGYRLEIDGREVFEGTLPLGTPGVFSLFEGEGSEEDALVLVTSGTEVSRAFIATEARQDEGTTIELTEGSWVPGSTANGGQAKVWVFEMPGSGMGTVLFDDIGQGDVCWPTLCSPF